MPLPDFTADEQYVIAQVKASAQSAGADSYLWGYMVGGCTMAGFAVVYDSQFMLLTAFALVCGFRIYEDFINRRSLPLWRSILAKYEAALTPQEPAEPR